MGRTQKAPIRRRQKSEPWDCSQCRGACCEELELPDLNDEDANWWLILHGKRIKGGTRLEVRCGALSGRSGKCIIYADRPQVCVNFERGGPECRDVVRRRRPELWKEWKDE